MRITTTFALAASILIADALTLLPRTDGLQSRVVQHEIEKLQVSNPIQRSQNDRARQQRRQSGTLSVELANEETLYFMDVKIGTPAQSIKLHVDTGSSDLWVNVANSQICAQSNHPCAASGTYSANDSSTYQYMNSVFNITYVDGTGATGDYASDVVEIGGTTLKDQTFGIGYTSSAQQGILGLGYPLDEALASYTDGQTYPNVPQQLVDNGVINSQAYSLWLNDLQSSTGTILFGGVNTEKFSGSLETLPIIKEDGFDAEFIIALTGVGANGTAGSIGSNLRLPALLDSGSSLTYLPTDITDTIYNAVGAQYNQEQGTAYVDCGLAKSDQSIEFTFSSPTISVPMSELIVITGSDGGENICIMGISPIDSGTLVLGDTFIRSAYIVYDLTNNEISLAQTKFNSTTDNIMEISNSSGVPDSKTVPNAVTSVSGSSGGSTNEGPASPSSSSAAASTAAIGFNLALLGAAGAGALFIL